MSYLDERMSEAIGGQAEPEEERPYAEEDDRARDRKTEKKKRREKKPEPEKKQKSEKKRRTETAQEEFVPDTSRWTQADEEEAAFEEKLLREQELSAMEAKRSARIKVVIDAVLITMCVYMVFLIYGVFNTDFKYGDTGEVESVVLSVEDLAERARYSVVLDLYYKCRNEYQEILKLDWMLVQGTVDNKSLAPKYEIASGKCATLRNQIQGADIDVKYYQIGSLLDSWASSACDYCEFTAIALTANNSEAEYSAVEARENTSSLFYDISQNMVILGQDLNGVDTADIYNWDPEAYVRKEMTGVE